MQDIVEKKGWRYINVDLKPERKSSAVCADAHALPFKDETFSLVIAKDSLEHFINPWQSVREVRRVLRDGGAFVIWVPFMWPFHGDDFYRYTPLAFEKLLEGFRIIRFDTPVWVFGVIGLALIEMLKRLRCAFLERPIRTLTHWLDRVLQPPRTKPRSFAGAYLIVAVKEQAIE